MLNFDEIRISSEKTNEDNFKVIKSYMDDMADKLNMLSQMVDEINDRTKGVN